MFVPGGQPTVTYVDRAKLDLEGRLNDAITKGYGIVVVTGPTKSGKTVLCRNVVGDDAIIVEGGQVRSDAEFWNMCAARCAVNIPESQSASQGRDEQHGDSIEIGAGALGFKAAGKGSKSKTESVVRSENRLISSHLIDLISASMKSSDKLLLVDDFQYINTDAQQSIIRSLKSLVYEGISVVLLAVPHRACDPVNVEREMEGRFRHLEIPSWSSEELSEIPQRGFPKLNVSVPPKIVDVIVENSFGNPLLCQEICSQLCIRHKIYKTAEQEFPIDPNFDLISIFSSVAADKGYPVYTKLRSGPNIRKSRQERKYKDGRIGDIYSVILDALCEVGPKERNSYEEIRSALKDLLVESDVPQKNEVTSACDYMTSIAREKFEGEPAAEWVKEDDMFIITDPFLLFYMRWGDREYKLGLQQ